MMQFPISKKISYISLLIALSLIFSYVENLIPVNLGIPGVKLGLANIVTVITLYLFGFGYALFVCIVRILLSGILFGNMYSILYSLAGGILSSLIMYLMKKNKSFSIIGVSIAGGVFHNLGQLTVAALVIEQLKLYYYGPVLIISGIITGSIIGSISSMVLKRVETYVRL